MNRYSLKSNGTLYECPPGYYWNQARCMCLPGETRARPGNLCTVVYCAGYSQCISGV